VYDSGVLTTPTTGFVTESDSFTVSATDVANYDYLAIAFIARMDAETTGLANQYVNIDNVSVIPEPQSMVLMMIGLGLVGLISRARRR
jgi:hypothetical protein